MPLMGQRGILVDRRKSSPALRVTHTEVYKSDRENRVEKLFNLIAPRQELETRNSKDRGKLELNDLRNLRKGFKRTSGE